MPVSGAILVPLNVAFPSQQFPLICIVCYDAFKLELPRSLLHCNIIPQSHYLLRHSLYHGVLSCQRSCIVRTMCDILQQRRLVRVAQALSCLASVFCMHAMVDYLHGALGLHKKTRCLLRPSASDHDGKTKQLLLNMSR